MQYNCPDSGFFANFAFERLLAGFLIIMNKSIAPLDRESTTEINDRPYSLCHGGLYVVRILLLLAIILLFPSVTSALGVNDFTFSHLGLADGLNSQRIYSLKQTDDGAVWLTTESFVARYNGSGIENFNLTENGITRNKVGRNPRFVQSREDDGLQVFDAGGCVYEYNAVQNRFDTVFDLSRHFNYDFQLNDVYREGDTYWMALSHGIYMMRRGKVLPVLQNVYASCIVRGADGLLLFGTRQGVKSLGRHDGKASEVRLQDYLPHDVVSGYYDGDTRLLWLGTYDRGIITVDGKGMAVTVKGIPNYPVRSIVAYDNLTMLVGVDGCGVYQASRLPSVKDTASVLFNANDGENGVLHGNGIYALLVDAWRDIFVGSYSGGIDMARPVGNTVKTYTHQRNNPRTLLNDHVNCVAQLSSSALAIGTDDGISILNPLTGEWRHTARGIVVLSLCPRPDGKGFLAATYGNGVCEISASGEVRKLYDAEVLGENHVHDLLFDKNGHLWIGCQDARLVEVTQEGFRYYPVDNVKSLALLPDGRIAAGTITGLYMVTPGQNEVKELPYFSSDPNHTSCYVLDLFVHDGHYIDIATYGGGLYVYDLRTGNCRQFTMNDGLPSNTVTGVTQDDLGRLWFATDRGLSFAHPDSLDKIINVNYHYGLQREYSHGAALRLQNGNLLFGSEAGAVMVNPHYVQPHNYKVKLSFTGISCNESDSEKFKEQAAKMLGEGKLSLSYAQRTFELYFESIYLRYQFDIAYQYKVGNGTWSPLTTQQYIRFVNLEPGTHRLTVRAVSKSNRVVLGERHLTITVSRPWWNSWWMWSIYILFIISLFYGAWWTYGLHTRYMRHVVNALEHDNGDSAETSRSGLKRHDVDPDISTDTEPGPVSGDVTDGRATDEANAAAEMKQKSDFMDTVTRHLLNHISESEFTVDSLCREMAMSRTVFYVKLKSYTGKSPQEFIRAVRLERAAVLLRAGHHVGDVAGEVGYDNAKYFSTAFKKYFGVSPSKYK